MSLTRATVAQWRREDRRARRRDIAADVVNRTAMVLAAVLTLTIVGSVILLVTR